MARYRGPRLKACRRFGAILPGLTTTVTLDRPFPPGQHGMRRRGKVSDYKIRLIEKQKLRYHYGVLERQFKRYVAEALRLKGPTGANLARLLESRLDNVVWRLGIAPTIPAARQLVVHGHILVDGKRVDRPSYGLRTGQTVGVHPKSKDKAFMQESIEQGASRLRPDYLEFDPAKGEGKLIGPPATEHVPFEVNTQAVIEYYSQQL